MQYVSFLNRYCPFCHVDLSGYVPAVDGGHYTVKGTQLSGSDMKTICRRRCQLCDEFGEDEDSMESPKDGCYGKWKRKLGLMLEIDGNRQNATDSGLVPILDDKGRPATPFTDELGQYRDSSEEKRLAKAVAKIADAV